MYTVLPNPGSCNSSAEEESINPNFKTKSPELIVLVDFVFPWGIEYPVVYLPQSLFTLGCLQIS